jgi:hypothetical protein
LLLHFTPKSSGPFVRLDASAIRVKLRECELGLGVSSFGGFSVPPCYLQAVQYPKPTIVTDCVFAQGPFSRSLEQGLWIVIPSESPEPSDRAKQESDRQERVNRNE